VGFGALFLLKRLTDIYARTTLTIITAFACYMIADHLGVSGVIATVTGGIYFGLQIPEFATSQGRMNAEATWNSLLFIINGLVFTLIGLELPRVLKSLGSYSVVSLIIYSIIIVVTVMVTRIIWMYPAAYLPRKLIREIERKDP